MFTKILIAYDGSENAHMAAEMTGRLVKGLDTVTDVWIVTVVESVPREIQEPYSSQFIEENMLTGQNLLNEGKEIIGDEINTHSELLFGAPAHCILEVAEARGCDLIIMGAIGMSLLERLLLGSQTQKVISHAKCPVLVVK